MYNSLFLSGHRTMDAEQINAISNRLSDLSARAAELRRYL